MKKKTLIIILIVLLAGAMTAAFIIGTMTSGERTGDDYGDDDFSEYIDDEGSSVVYDEEDDGAEFDIVESPVEKFYGTWVANSGLAHQTYGNLEITISEGGVWTGNITDTDIKGTWTETDTGLALTSELFECTLSFADTGSLLLIEDTGEEYADDLVTVLTKQD